MGRLIAYRAHEYVYPLVAGESSAGLDVFVELGAGDLDRLHPAQHERPRHAAVEHRLVVGQFHVGPNAARQRPFMFVDGPLVDMDLIQPGGGKPSPILAALVLFVERDGHQVDELHRAGSLEPRLHQLALVGPHNPLRDGLLDALEPVADLLLFGRRAVFSQQILQHVDRDAEADLQPVDEVFPHDAAGKSVYELLVERIDQTIWLLITIH